jgi:proline iminopeptidase
MDIDMIFRLCNIRNNFRLWKSIVSISALLASLVGCSGVPRTIENDPTLPFVELEGYKFHVRAYGSPDNPPLIVVHGGPGGDSKSLYPIQDLAKENYLVFYDQRGAGLSPRVNAEELTIDSSLHDLDLFVSHYGKNAPVKLIGHSWGAMLVVAYLGQHPERISHAVVAEPGILNPASAQVFVKKLKASQSWLDALPMLKFILQTPLVASQDGHERFDYVMTRLMNQSTPGSPYQCEGQTMPPDAIERAGYASFNQMLKPVFNDPANFKHDLTKGIHAYQGKLLMISSECSFIGYEYQQQQHMPYLPKQTAHIKGKAMGHNMLTLNPVWSVEQIRTFFESP